MALSRYMMQRILTEDGHLDVEGTETEAQLRYALTHLFRHYRNECSLKNPWEKMLYEVLPDASVLATGSTYRHPRKNRKKTDDVETSPDLL